MSATGIVTRSSLLIQYRRTAGVAHWHGAGAASDADGPEASSGIRRTTPKRQLFRMAGVRPESRGSADHQASDVPCALT